MVAVDESKGNESLELLAVAKDYEWGICGSNSLVGKLYSANCEKPIEDENKPYAELWMGTHPTAPTKVKSNGKELKEVIETDLPFLFKVLSVGKALSIQAHPDIELAKDLHARDPKNYKDSNHKPEMAIALTSFEALCGFRPIEEIVKDLETVPEFATMASEESVKQLKSAASSKKDSDEQRQALKSFFSEFIVLEQEKVLDAIKRFEMRITTMNRKSTPLEELCLRLNGQFPGEVGCFCVFLLNYITLQPGEAIFLAANEPHAYLSGDCIECMALSDNVVRAGLTPKFKDVDTLIKMLTYKTYQRDELAMLPTKLTDRPLSLLYKPPIKEFQVIKINPKLGEREIIKTGESKAILLCVQGDLTLEQQGTSQRLAFGSVTLLAEKFEGTITCNSTEALLFQASSQ